MLWAGNNESKPVWLCVQAFEGGAWLMPSVREMRGQLYTGIVSGSTGIIYFASKREFDRVLTAWWLHPCPLSPTVGTASHAHLTSLPLTAFHWLTDVSVSVDSYVTRAGDVFGIAPKELGNATYFDSSSTDAKPTASPSLLALSAALWDGMKTPAWMIPCH